MYISEIASADVRGFLSAIQKVAGHLGILISYSLGAYLDWRQLAMLVSIAPMLLFLTVIYIPETPSFLVLNGRDDEAYRYAYSHQQLHNTPFIRTHFTILKFIDYKIKFLIDFKCFVAVVVVVVIFNRSLQWLRGPNKNVELELETIRSNIQSTKTRTNIFPTITLGNLMTMTSVQAIYTKVKSILKNVRIVKPLSITCGLMVFQRFTGMRSAHTPHISFIFFVIPGN